MSVPDNTAGSVPKARKAPKALRSLIDQVTQHSGSDRPAGLSTAHRIVRTLIFRSQHENAAASDGNNVRLFLHLTLRSRPCERS